MKPSPDELLAQMPIDSIGILTSVVLLGAALQAKRGTFSPIESIVDPFTGKKPTAKEEALIKKAHDQAMQEFRSATPDELDHAIALYEAHLKRNGLKVEWGASH